MQERKIDHPLHQFGGDRRSKVLAQARKSVNFMEVSTISDLQGLPHKKAEAGGRNKGDSREV